jgi:hypothetical protein
MNSNLNPSALAQRARELAEKRDRQAADARGEGTEQLNLAADSYRMLADVLERQTVQLNAFRLEEEDWRARYHPFD